MSESFRVLAAADLPEGQAKVVEVNGRSIAVYNAGGTIHAIDSFCAHRGGPLAEGMFDRESVVCPWHGFRFTLSDGVCSTNPALRVRCYAARIEGSDIFVEIAPTP
jgi:nitrite reductase/ring-hydroxylating ferredoxin subunit